MFVITGITGKVGGEVARNLLAGNQPVRAVVRDVRKGEPWAQLGCDLVHADINDAGALTSGVHFREHKNAAGLPEGVSYQCHTNCDEWRQKVNKDRKEKVNPTTPI